MKKEIGYNQMQHTFEIFKELDKLRKSKEYCDFIIKVGSEEIHVNRNVLVANSEYFRATFSHDTLENQTGVVELEDLDPECVKICADFMYGGKISISVEKWADLVHCADRLQLIKLRTFLEQFLKCCLAPDVFYRIRNIANTYGFPDLVAACDEFAAENFQPVSQLDEFLQLKEEDLISWSTSGLNRSSHTVRLKAILRWIKHDVENRKNHLLGMLKILNLSKTPASYLRFLLEKDELVSKSFECSKLLSFSLLDTLQIPSCDTNPTGDDINSILVFDDTSRHLQCFNPQSNTWNQMQALLPDMQKDSFTAVTLHNHVFVFLKNRKVLRLNYTDPNATWENVTGVIGQHVEPQVVADLRYIYVVGGSEYGIERYDTITEEVCRLAESKALTGSSCVLLDGKIFCVGGCGNGVCVNSLQVFNLGANDWTTMASLPEGREWVGATACLGKVFVIGGQITDKLVLSKVECYDPSADIWASLPPLPVRRTALPVVTVGNSIFAIGECGSDSRLIQRYNIKNKTWTRTQGKSLKVLSCVGIEMKT